jgi:hypothetical protein
MIAAPTTSFYLVKVEGEAAGTVTAGISPSTAADIATAVLVSGDFHTDILTVEGMHQTVEMIKSTLHSQPLEAVQKYNPLYLPGDIGALDDMLHLDSKGDTMRFIGMGGNPFTFNTLEVTSHSETVISGKVEYRPFDLPPYADITAAASTSTRLN